LALRPKSLALTLASVIKAHGLDLGTQVLDLGLGTHVLGLSLGLGLVTSVLGLDLGSQVLVNSTDRRASNDVRTRLYLSDRVWQHTVCARVGNSLIYNLLLDCCSTEVIRLSQPSGEQLGCHLW